MLRAPGHLAQPQQGVNVTITRHGLLRWQLLHGWRRSSAYLHQRQAEQCPVGLIVSKNTRAADDGLYRAERYPDDLGYLPERVTTSQIEDAGALIF
jgi:hypothetical protein